MAEFNFTGSDANYDYLDEYPSVDISLKEEKFYPDIAKVSVSLIICVFGIFGSLIVVFVIIVLKEYQKSVTHLYILQLAIADALLLVTLPFSVSEDLKNAFRFPEWICKGKETILFLNYYSSMLFLTVMSLDRYFAVCHQFSVKVAKLRKTSSAVVIALIIWLISALLSIPVLLYSYKTGINPNCLCSYAFPKYDSKTTICIHEGFRTSKEIETCLNLFIFNEPKNKEIYCRPSEIPLAGAFPLFSVNTSIPFSYYSSQEVFFNKPTIITKVEEEISNRVEAHVENACHYWDRSDGWAAFLIFNFIIMFLMPLFVMVACYGLIIRRLTEAQSTGSTSSTVSFTVSKRSAIPRRRKPSSKSEKDRKRVTIMCATLVACFVICWLPFHAIHLAKLEGISNSTAKFCEKISIAGSLLAFLNSALNPYLYSFLGTNFLRRWSEATNTVKNSVTQRSLSSSSALDATKFYRRKQDGNGSSGNTTIFSTKNRRNLTNKSGQSNSDSNAPLKSENKRSADDEVNSNTIA